MNRLTLISSVVLAISASVVLAGGGGEELPIAAPVAAPVAESVAVVGATLACDDPAVNDVPSVYEMWRPETNWLRKEWQPSGWNPLNAEYVTTVLATPDNRCDQEWKDAFRPLKTDDRDNQDRVSATAAPTL